MNTATMSTDASRKSIGFRIYQEFCRMFPTGLGKVNPVEMSPFLMTMRLIKQYYGFSKPEVYSTLIALLQDYDPSLGVKHRERTMRYIRLLLVDQPDLADYLLYLLPECVRSNDNEESHQLQQQQQQQPSKGIHCSAQTVRCEKRSTAESLREEPIHSSSLLQRMVVLPINESFQDFTTTAVRIAPAVNSAAGITTTANSVLTFGKNSKIALPHLVKTSAGQMKQLQVQSKPTTLSTLLYSPNVVIKSELLTDASSIITLPRISSTVAGTATPINAVQDAAANSLARHLGLKLATHITALPRDGADKAALSSSKAPLPRTASRTVLEGSYGRDGRTSKVSLDDRLENIIKKFGKETQTSTGTVTSMHQQTVGKSFMPSSFFCPKLSCIRNNDAKETIVVQKQPEFISRSAYTSVANGLVRCMPTFPQSQPMFVIEKTRRNVTTSSFDSAGIRIIKKSKVATSGLPLAKSDKPPAAAVAESSPLISLKKLVAGVGLLKSFEDEAVYHSPTVISNRDAALENRIGEKAAVCDKPQGTSAEDTENDGAKESDHMETMTSLESLLEPKISEVQEKNQENETKLNGDSFRPLFESCFDKEVCPAGGSAESEGRLSPYSDETSHSLFMNDGTSDYHVSDEEQALPTGGSTKQDINGNKCSLPAEPSHRDVTSTLDFEAQPSNEEPLCKKMRVTMTSADSSSQYEGRTYLARLMELPSPPNYGHDYPWDLLADDRKRKGKIAIKRKRKK